MIKRILVIASCVALLVCSFALPASATALDYNDYITNIQVDGDNDIVTVTIPLQGNTQYALYENSNLIGNIFGNEIVGQFKYGNSYNLYIMPTPFDSVLLSNIPSGTTVSYDYYITENYPAYNTPIVLFKVYYYMADGSTIIKSYELNRSPFEWAFPIESTLDIPDGAVSFSTEVGFLNFSPANDKDVIYVATFGLKSYTLTMTISSLYRLQQQTGQTNVILKEVEKQLADQGKTLDEVLQQQQQTNDQLGDLNDKQDQTNEKLDGIINDKVDSTPPSGGGAVGDLDDAEGQIRDDAQSGLDQGLDVQQSALQILTQYWSAFACVGWIFNLFADLPFFSGLLYVSFALGITGAILGLGLSLARAGDAGAARQAAAEARRNSYYSRLGRGRKGG